MADDSPAATTSADAFLVCSAWEPPPGSVYSRAAWREQVQRAHLEGSRNAWRDRLQRERAIAAGSRQAYRDEGAEPVRPSFVERRHGLTVTWVMDLDEQLPHTVRMVQVEVFDPARSALRPRRRDRILTALRRFFAPTNDSGEASAAFKAGLLGAGSCSAVLVSWVNARLGVPVPALAALALGAAAGAGGLYTAVCLRLGRRWRTIALQPDPARSGQRPMALEAVEILLDAHRLAVRQIEAHDPDPEDGDAVRSLRWLAWELAGTVTHERPGERDDLVRAAGDLRARLAERDAARLAEEARFERSLRSELEEHDLLDPGELVNVACVRSRWWRRRATVGRGDDAAWAAAAYARDSASALTQHASVAGQTVGASPATRAE